MTKREDVIRYCLTYPDAYEDYPFRDGDWCALRHRGSGKVFAFVFQREGRTWVNVKCDPAWGDFWRRAYAAVRPAYHMNKTHWNSIVLDGTMEESEICAMIEESYRLTLGNSGEDAP